MMKEALLVIWCLMFMHPWQIISKTQIAEQIEHFDVSIHGTGLSDSDMQMLTAKSIFALKTDFKTEFVVHFCLCQVDQLIDESTEA